MSAQNIQTLLVDIIWDIGDFLALQNVKILRQPWAENVSATHTYPVTAKNKSQAAIPVKLDNKHFVKSMVFERAFATPFFAG